MHGLLPAPLLIAVLLLPPSTDHGEGLTKAEVSKLGTAATPFVHVKPANASGTAFCVDASGLFITNEHVVRGAAEITLVLNSGEKDQKAVKASVIRADAKGDLALLRVEGESKLPALSLGTLDKA